MLNWKSLVHERLNHLRLEPTEREEVIAELSSHLEDAYASFCKQGFCAEEAQRRSLAGIPWRRLTFDIQNAKRKGVSMNKRTKQFLFPALASLAISEGVLLAISFTVGSHPHLFLRGSRMIYLPWLISLPIAGATAGYFSRRAGSKLKTIVTASLFPAAVGLSFVFVGIGITLITGARIFAQPQWLYVSQALALGVIVPAIALLVGTLPFLKQHRVGPSCNQ